MSLTGLLKLARRPSPCSGERRRVLKSNFEVPLNKEQVCAKARDAHKASAFVVGCVQEMVSTSLLVFVPGEVYGVAACYPHAFYLLGVFW